jgi:hypothetical protein
MAQANSTLAIGPADHDVATDIVQDPNCRKRVNRLPVPDCLPGDHMGFDSAPIQKGDFLSTTGSA